MSYSFSVTAATKAEAKEKIAAKFDEVQAAQPVHAADRAAAQAAAEAFVDVLGEPAEGQHYAATVNGWVGWRAENDFTSANVQVTATLAAAT